MDAVGTIIADRPPQASRIVVRTGLRMMPTFPRPSLSFRTAGFPQYGWKMCISDGTFLWTVRLSSLPACAKCASSLSPSFVSIRRPQKTPSTESGNGGHIDTAKSGRGQPAPQGSSLRFGLFCPNPSSLNRPHPPHSGTFRFRRSATYTERLRCAGAPRRPASGSELSLVALYEHVALYDPGGPMVAYIQFLHPLMLAFAWI